jgi:hypothetical protein
MSKKTKLLGSLLVIAYFLAAAFAFTSLPFLAAAAVDGVLTALLLVLGIFLCRGETEHHGAWDYIRKSRRWLE